MQPLIILALVGCALAHTVEFKTYVSPFTTGSHVINKGIAGHHINKNIGYPVGGTYSPYYRHGMKNIIPKTKTVHYAVQPDFGVEYFVPNSGLHKSVFDSLYADKKVYGGYGNEAEIYKAYKTKALNKPSVYSVFGTDAYNKMINGQKNGFKYNVDSMKSIYNTPEVYKYGGKNVFHNVDFETYNKMIHDQKMIHNNPVFKNQGYNFENMDKSVYNMGNKNFHNIDFDTYSKMINGQGIFKHNTDKNFNFDKTMVSPYNTKSVYNFDTIVKTPFVHTTGVKNVHAVPEVFKHQDNIYTGVKTVPHGVYNFDKTVKDIHTTGVKNIHPVFKHQEGIYKTGPSVFGMTPKAPMYGFKTIVQTPEGEKVVDTTYGTQGGFGYSTKVYEVPETLKTYEHSIKPVGSFEHIKPVAAFKTHQQYAMPVHKTIKY